MTDTVPSAPSRTDVEATWESLLAGRITREDAHAWAVPWVDGESDAPLDTMTFSGLEHLHGFDLRYDPERPGIAQHGRGAPYLHSQQDMAEAFARWRRDSARYDADPIGYLRKVRQQALAALEAEERGHGQ